LHDFGAHIGGSTTENLELSVRSSATTEAEIDQLKPTVFPVNKDVFKFDISTMIVSQQCKWQAYLCVTFFE